MDFQGRQIMKIICVFVHCALFIIDLSWGAESQHDNPDSGISSHRGGSTTPNPETGGLNNTQLYLTGQQDSGNKFPDNQTDDHLPSYMESCPSNVQCSLLGAECIQCDFDHNCLYGKDVNVTCRAKPHVVCEGEQEFLRAYNCRYCYQTPPWQHECYLGNTHCRVVTAPLKKHETNCTVKSNILCLGNRQFHKMVPCNWTSGKRWSTALALSITLGGFGADRFYLGLWREGIGKLFSFGGLGVWTLVDVVLIASGYVGPADGSLYIF